MFNECWANCDQTAWSKRSKSEKMYRPKCFICFDGATDVHHMTYDNSGHELSKDLVPLCRRCHVLVEKCKFYPRSDSYYIVVMLAILNGALNGELHARINVDGIKKMELTPQMREVELEIKHHPLGIAGFLMNNQKELPATIMYVNKALRAMQSLPGPTGKRPLDPPARTIQ